MLLTEEEKLIRQTAKDFSDLCLKPFAAAWASAESFPVEALKKLADLGFMGMLVDENAGGSHIGYLGYVLVLEEIAAGDASTATILSVHNSLVSGSINHYGNAHQKNRYLNNLSQGKSLGAFCLTESDAGSDAAEIKTVAKRLGDHYLINGSKEFITSGKQANIAIVFAKTDPKANAKGISAFIVPTDTPGYIVRRIEKKMGQSAALTVALSFENLNIPAENRLGEEGQGYKIALSQLESGRLGIAAQCIGIARAAFEASLLYAKERVTFGKPIIEHQAIGFKLADMATEITAARQLLHHAARLKDAKQPSISETAMAKLFASEMAERVCKEAIQIHGGYGYLQDFIVERLYRDVRACTLYEGTSEIQRMVIARALEKSDGRS